MRERIISLHPDNILKLICTTNSIKSLNSLIRKAITLKKLFLTDEAVYKRVYLAIRHTSTLWQWPSPSGMGGKP